jgi:hypothetical protein
MFIIEAHYISYEVHSEFLRIMQIKLCPPSVLRLIFMSALTTLKSFIGSVCFWSTLRVVHVTSSHCPPLYSYQVLTARYGTCNEESRTPGKGLELSTVVKQSDWLWRTTSFYQPGKVYFLSIVRRTETFRLRNCFLPCEVLPLPEESEVGTAMCH